MSQERSTKKGTAEKELDRKKKYEEKKSMKKELIEEKRKIQPVTATLEQPVFKIKLKESRKIVVEGSKSLNIRLKELRIPKLNVILMNVKPSRPLSPKIKVLSIEEPKSIRIQLYEPLTVQTYTQLLLRIRMKTLQDISVRPLLKSEQINLTRINVSLPKVWPLPALQSKLIHFTSIEPHVPLKFELRLPSELLGKQFEEKLEITPKPTAGVSELEAPFLEAEEEEVPDIFTLIFTISGGKIDSGNPKVIGIKQPENDSYMGALQTLCMRIYREKVGGKPKPRTISKIDEIFKPEVEKWMEAEDRIFSVKLDKAKNLDKNFRDRIRDRVEDLFSQRFGFIIFNEPILFVPKHHIVEVINIEPRKMNFELKKEIASMIWGFVSLDDIEFKDFDYIFETARIKFEEKLRSIGEPYLSVTKRDEGLHESDDLHYSIKLFLVKYLAHEMNLRTVDQIKEFIKTEEEYGGKRPDVHVTRNASKFANQVFEVETLFSEGDYPLKKIDETIEKYEKTSETSEVPLKVNIILDNITFLRHINGLRKKLNIHKSLKKEGKRKFDLEFYTLDLQNEKLIPISDIVEKLRSLNQKFKEKSYS